MPAAATLSHSDLSPATREMSWPFVKSLVFHGFIVFLVIAGLPYVKQEPPDIFAAPMTVELIEEADIAETTKPPKKAEPAPEIMPDEPPPMHKQMPQVTSKTPPKPVAPERPAPVERVSLPPDETQTADVVEKPEPANPSKPQKKPAPTREVDEEESQEKFRSLLRNLMPADATPQQKSETEDTAEADTPEDSPLARFSQRMTTGEHEALRRQLSQCWSLLAGARYAEDLVVKIRLFMNPDRTIRNAEIVQQIRYKTDKHFRAAAEAALRAVYKCSPLELPRDKYDQWKVIVVTFDPSEVL